MRLSKTPLAFALALIWSDGANGAPIRNGELPAVSPDGKRIAFETDRSGKTELRVIAVDGSAERVVVGSVDGPIAWTRNGRRLLFTRAQGDESDLYEIAPDGTHQRHIARLQGRSPTLSPNGKRVVYMAGTWSQTKLTVSNLDGSNPILISDGQTPAWNPYWSPDGSKIAFTGSSPGEQGLNIFIVNADGTDRRQLTHFAKDSGSAQWPVWSPDGKHLAIQANGPEKGKARIWLVDVATGQSRVIADHESAYLDETPSWFPDRRKLAIQSDRTGRMEVWVISIDGSHQRQLTK